MLISSHAAETKNTYLADFDSGVIIVYVFNVL